MERQRRERRDAENGRWPSLAFGPGVSAYSPEKQLVAWEHLQRFRSAVADRPEGTHVARYRLTTHILRNAFSVISGRAFFLDYMLILMMMMMMPEVMFGCVGLLTKCR